ncbi:MAG TPA: hypothetical protein VD813_04065, partial [Pseudonocardia sp.]|nr:hypothetical protein [Pseudonocardia sp.]
MGPSERPPVAVRGESVAGPQTPAPPTPAPEALPAPEPQNTPLDFRDCTDGVLASLPSPPPQDRQLRVECAAVPVPTDPADPLLGRTPLGVIRVGLPDGLAERPPLLAVGDSAGEPSALHAAELAG